MNRLRRFFLDSIGFRTPQAIVFNLMSIFTLLAAIPTTWLKYSPVRCIFKNLIFPIIFRGHCPTVGIFAGCECPACGMTRAMSRLLHGDFASAMTFNRGVIAVFLAMCTVLVINLIRSIRLYRKTGDIFGLTGKH